MQNEELINLFTNLIESTQYLKKGTVLSFDNQKAIVRLADQTTIDTKNLNVNRLGDCLVIKTNEGFHAFSENRNNQNQVIHRSINQRVNRTKDAVDFKQPEVYYLISQIVEEPIKSTTPSKFIRVDNEISTLINRNKTYPESQIEGPFKRRYCIETVDAIGIDTFDTDEVFDTLTECLLEDITKDERNEDTNGKPSSNFVPGSLGTITLHFYLGFGEEEYEEYVSQYNLESDFPNLSPFTCSKGLFHFGTPIWGGYPIITLFQNVVMGPGEPTPLISYAKEWVKTFWSKEDINHIYFPDDDSIGYDSGRGYHLRDWVSDENNPANIWYNWGFEFAYRHANMGAFTNRPWGGFEINCQTNRAEQIIGFMQSYGWQLDTFTCPPGSGNGEGNPPETGPSETKPPTENEASYHIPLSEKYKVKFYLSNSNQENVLLLHEMSVDDYFWFWLDSKNSGILKNEIVFREYARDLLKRYYISEPLLKYFNNTYLSLFDMYFEYLKRDNYFSFQKINSLNAIYNREYLYFNNLRDTYPSISGAASIEKSFTKQDFLSNAGNKPVQYPFTSGSGLDTNSFSYSIKLGTHTQFYQQSKIFYKSKRDILILINEGLVSENFQEYQFYKTHLIYVKNFKIKNKVTYTYPNIDETLIQDEIDLYSVNKLLNEYYKYSKTLYRIDNQSSSLVMLYSQFNSIDSQNGLPNFYDLTSYTLFSKKITNEKYLAILEDEEIDSVLDYYDSYLNSKRLYYKEPIDTYSSYNTRERLNRYNFENILLSSGRGENLPSPFYHRTTLTFDQNIPDIFYDGKYLTRLYKSYTIKNFDESFFLDKRFFEPYDILGNYPLNGLDESICQSLHDLIAGLVFTNKKELELVFRRSEPHYNSPKTDVPMQLLNYNLNYGSSYATIVQRYNIAKNKPPIFLNLDNNYKDIKVTFKLPKNLPLNTQLEKKSCNILTMQLIP